MNSEIQKPKNPRKLLIQTLLILVFLSIYFGYAYVSIQMQSGPVDYETFMRIGDDFLQGKPVYTENSFYPMPYVGVFSIFSQLPFSISFLIWVFVPVLFALIISDWSPLILLFAPLFGHFAGGQTAFFALAGFWGYRKNQNAAWSGVWLALLLIKPQLAIATLLWVSWKWLQQIIKERKIPIQALVFLGSITLIFLPWFFVNPNWFSEWIGNPRSLRLRAMAAIFPRLTMYLNLSPIIFWGILGIITLFLLYLIIKTKKISLDRVVLISFMVLPILHDYDLIQIIPILDNRKKRIVAVVSSIPLWVTILFAYNNDHAWITAALIAPILLVYSFFLKKT
jgi:hypothetical protein